MHQNRNIIPNLVRNNPLWNALLIQLCVLFLLFWLIRPFAWHHQLSLDIWLWIMLQGVMSAAVSYLFKQPTWWRWIHLTFPPALWLGITQTLIPAWVFGAIALLLALVFSNVWRERVPLYLSNEATQTALVTLAQEKQVTFAIDLGAGLGGVVRALAGAGIKTLGVEASPILVALAAWLGRNLPQAQMVRGDIWQTDISQADLVYVFLSPVPMPDIWHKACKEMKAGAWLVSNSFAITDIEPEEVWELSDARQTQLWLYRIPEKMLESA